MRLESCPPPSVGGAAASRDVEQALTEKKGQSVCSVGRHLARRS